MPIQYTEMNLRNRTTSELRTVFRSPLGVPNSQVPLYIHEVDHENDAKQFILAVLMGVSSQLELLPTLSNLRKTGISGQSLQSRPLPPCCVETRHYRPVAG